MAESNERALTPWTPPVTGTADELRAMGYTLDRAVHDGWSINLDDDRFAVAYRGEWGADDTLTMFMHHEVGFLVDRLREARCGR